jgi:hypothetical protein
MFKLCPFFALPLYLVATGLRTIQFLLSSILAYHFSLPFHPNYCPWSSNYPVLLSFKIRIAELGLNA